MIIRHKKPGRWFYGWIPPNGRWASYLQELTIPDELAITNSFKASKERDEFDIVSFDNSPYDFVVQQEIEGIENKRQIKDNLLIESDGQTSFTLSESPLDSPKVECKYGGIDHEIDIDFTISENLLTWICPDIVLRSGQYLRVNYYILE